jgi:hypothetical protein
MLATVFAQCLYSASVSLLYMKCKPAVKKGTQEKQEDVSKFNELAHYDF